MGLSNSPKIATNGLVFAYDSNNIKSYKGPPLTNKTQYLNVYNTNGTGNSFVGDTEEAYIPSLGKTTVKTVKIQNNYPSVSDWCCPAPVQHADGFVVSPSTVYTYFILYKIESGYTHPNYMYRYEFTASGGSYVTEQGVHSDSNRTYLGDGWYYAWGTFTTNASTNWIGFCGSFYYRYSTSYDKFWVAKSAIIEGNWSGMHPKYWPSPGETRSNTQSLRDLTGQNTITATSLTYAADGTFSFNGSTDYKTIPNTTLGNGNSEWTVSCWMKTTTTTNDLGQGSILSNQSGGPVYSMLGVNNGKIVYWTYQNSAWAQKLGTGKTVNDGNWHMLTWVNYSNYTMDMYVDGLLDSNVANSTSGNNNPVDRIGGSWAGYFPGSIASLMRYTRALNADEVQQNFNSTRMIYIGTYQNPATSASAIRSLDAGASDGDYWYKPVGYTGNPILCYTNFSNAPSGKGYVLVARGRESTDWWNTSGQNTTGLSRSNLNVNTPIAVAPNTFVDGLIGQNWNQMKMLVNRINGGDSWYFQGTTSTSFSWTYFQQSGSSVNASATQYLAPFKTGSISMNWGSGIYWTDTLNYGGGNNCDRTFTWSWGGHGPYQGWSGGNECNPAGGFQNSSEGHSIQLVNCYIEC